ncbi:MAG: hypothetical protein KF884_07705 [Fimbriimonadaceae bacterium]|nr:hypothetical protein [Fimbriimonadaceae bacterium]QYK57435.1 MAG: hypothetical protein KF884_07705 [Fimbriimonadaceae bacterium]
MKLTTNQTMASSIGSIAAIDRKAGGATTRIASLVALASLACSLSAAPVYPATLTFNNGLFVPNSPNVLHFRDNSFLVCVPILNSFQYEVSGTHLGGPPTTHVQVTWTSSLNFGGSLAQSVELFNFQTLTWELLGSNSLNRAWETRSFTELTNPARFVSPTGLLRARVTGRVHGPFLGHVRTDELVWDVQ